MSLFNLQNVTKIKRTSLLAIRMCCTLFAWNCICLRYVRTLCVFERHVVNDILCQYMDMYIIKIRILLKKSSSPIIYLPS